MKSCLNCSMSIISSLTKRKCKELAILLNDSVAGGTENSLFGDI